MEPIQARQRALRVAHLFEHDIRRAARGLGRAYPNLTNGAVPPKQFVQIIALVSSATHPLFGSSGSSRRASAPALGPPWCGSAATCGLRAPTCALRCPWRARHNRGPLRAFSAPVQQKARPKCRESAGPVAIARPTALCSDRAINEHSPLGRSSTRCLHSPAADKAASVRTSGALSFLLGVCHFLLGSFPVRVGREHFVDRGPRTAYIPVTYPVISAVKRDPDDSGLGTSACE